MTIRVGSAASPRWFGMTLAGLDDFIPKLVEWGATAGELVLHHGPADDAVARVHILEEDWEPVATRFIAAGMICNIHAPLHPRFSLRRWRTDRDEIETGYLPVIAEAQRIAERQGETCTMVVHAANERGTGAVFNRDSTKEFLSWASDLIATTFPDVRVAVELRHSDDVSSEHPDSARHRLVELIDSIGDPSIGICWDLGHDWENSRMEEGWTPAPPSEFLRRVLHVHAHDAGPTGLVHYPLSSGEVPIAEMVAALVRFGWAGAITMELRYRFASELGDPHLQMARSYRTIRDMIEQATGQN
jgi:sugar phosphate isomerase/epimerase